MRLHHLTFEAIGPFPGRHVIDLDELASSGLYLLTGPTGSGKSTIIDAIVFALYGTPTASAVDGATKDRLHCSAAPESTPRVELVFSTDAGVYRVARTPEHTAPKRRGTGFTTRHATCTLIRLAGSEDAANEDAGEVIASSVQEAATEITRIIGLNRAEFTQTMVLPQGQFAQFLNAKPEERTSILRGLFGTAVYERLQARLLERSRAARAAVDRAHNRARQDLSTLAATLGRAPSEAGIEEEGEAWHTQVAALSALLDGDADPLEAAELTDILDAALQALESLHDRALDAHDAARAHADTAEAAARAARDLAAQQEAYRAALTTLEELAGREEEIAGHTAALRADDLARPARRAGTALRERLRTLAERLTELQASTDLPDGAEIPEDVDTAAAWMRSTPLVENLTAAREHLGAERDRLQAERGAIAGLRRLEERRRHLTDSLAHLATRIREAEERDEVLAAILEAAPARLQSARARVDACERAARDLPTRERDLAQAVQRAEAAHAATEVAATLERDGAELERVSTAYHEASLASAELHRRWARHAAGSLASDLTDGEPCPVCGAREHPAPASSREAVAEDELTAARSRTSALDRQQAALVTRIEAHRDRVKELTETAGHADPTQARDAEAQARERYEATRELAAHVGQARETLAEVERERVEAEAERSRLADQTAEDERTHAAGMRERDEILVQLRAGLGEYESADARDTALTAHLTAATTALTAAESAHEALTGARNDARDLECALHEAQLATFADANAAHLSGSAREKLTATIEAYREARAGAQSVVNDPDNRAAAKKPAADVAGAEHAERTARLALEEATARKASRHTWLETGRSARADLTASHHAYRTIAEDKAEECALGAIVDGQNERALTLITYVLLDMFESVLAATNARLEEVSSGRYTLHRSAERERGRGRGRRVGLALEIMDHAVGRTRPLATLSGGESFYTALCLALGLADTVRATHGGIEMNTLFIDEGFGSLDPATLDQVMTVLHSLHDSGRAVGVVSHVEEMKAQIADRIEVTRRSDDTSTVRVVCS
ncbi:MAG: SMC family ATPase [Bowdeniella nasicola]|nr:SMC family ATPase [Bowdeniella nasicola]